MITKTPTEVFDEISLHTYYGAHLRYCLRNDAEIMEQAVKLLELLRIRGESNVITLIDEKLA